MSTAPAGRATVGVVFLVCAMACFAVLDTAVKVVGAFISILFAVWFRYVFQAVAVTAVGAPGGVPGVTLFDGDDAGPGPTMFVATTVKV